MIEDSIEWTVNINDVVPENISNVYSIFSTFQSRSTSIKFRLVSKHWKSNIDEYLESRQVLRYARHPINHPVNPIIDYHLFEGLTKFLPNLRQLTINNFYIHNPLIKIMTDNLPHLE